MPATPSMAPISNMKRCRALSRLNMCLCVLKSYLTFPTVMSHGVLQLILSDHAALLASCRYGLQTSRGSCSSIAQFPLTGLLSTWVCITLIIIGTLSIN